MKKDIVKIITNNAIVGTIYFLFTFITSPFAFGVFQIRIAEALILLCFFRRDYIFGITVGCLLANIFGPGTLGIIDIIFGTLATCLSCLFVSFSKRLIFATFFPVVLNALIVGTELYFVAETSYSYFILVAFVGIGELLAVTLLGYIIFVLLGRNKYFLNLMCANQNEDFKW